MRPFSICCLHFLSLLLWLFLVSLFAGLPSCLAESSSKVIGVIDGDTIVMLRDGKKVRVVLRGVDCPELEQEFGKEAKEFTSQACLYKELKLEERGLDSWGRLVAEVYLNDGRSLNEELVSKGLAWWNQKYAPNETRLHQLQMKAQQDKEGLWAKNNPLPPWQFRHGKKSVKAEIKSPDSP